ncbi:dolichyl-phosphate-mannose--protein mannosyltransferase 1 [[Candida] anglica]|uniref:dolichyl-phosphate-mannose--protein mannosyltransferase n=1 Tax=[Candida] anglica TaxID=148631 RepID=A0ABP0EI09_9ASCO
MAAKKKSSGAAAVAAAAAASKKDKSLFSVDPVSTPAFAKGSVRSFVLTTESQPKPKTRSLISQEYVLLAVLLAASVYVRCKDLLAPSSVVFDEVHFGGFARKYILGEYFMDVHPPLAKMLFAAVGAAAGFKGDFEFKKISDEIPGTYYYYMRLFPAVLGVGTILLCYLTLRSSGCRPIVCLVTASLLAIENANVTLSRYILLDSPLLFFIAASIYALKKFEVQKPFTLGWYKALIACGISLGLAVSSKWVGLFTIAWVGVSCLYHLWFIVGDLTVSTKSIAHHFIARGAILLGIPMTLYLAFFAVHFKVLVNEGAGGVYMTPSFKSSLIGNSIPKDIVGNVGIGSIVTLRHLDTQGGYLHSHNHFYPAGSKQQQITLYPHIDSNNNWMIELYNETEISPEFVPLTDGMKIRLKHVNTGRRLHSHDEKAPVSERDWQKEASCYGYDGFPGDANDDFTVEVVKERSDKDALTEVKAIKTVFRLRHAMSGHYLFSSPVKLPKDWGFEQQEVTTASQGARHLTHWCIETNTNERVNDTIREIVNYPTLSLWDKFTESHKRMWQINQGLTEHHTWQSHPTEWPLLMRGINYWVKDNRQVYLIGNAVVWWLSTAGIVTFIIHIGISILKWQAGQKVATDKNVYNFNAQAFSYVVGWLLHYAPFYIMGRQLFLHHYIPAAYFGILALGHIFEVLIGYLSSGSKIFRRASYGVLALILTLSLLFYINYSSLIYATPWTKESCKASKALGTWDFDCNAFHNEYIDYSASSSAASDSLEPTPQPIENQEEGSRVEETPQAAQPEPIIEERSTVQAEEADVVEQEEIPVAPPAAVDVDSETPIVDEQVVEQVQSVAEEATEKVEEVIEEEVEPFYVAPPVEDIEPTFVDHVAEQAQEAAEPVVEQAQEAAEPVVEQAREVVEQVAEQAQEAAEPVVEQAQEVVEQAQEAAEPVVEQAQEVVEQAQEAAEPVVEQAQEVVEQAQEAAEPVVEQAQEVVEPVVEQAQEAAESFYDAVAEQAEPVVEQAQQIVEEVTEKSQ